MDTSVVVQNLESFIEAEMRDAELYTTLARQAPNENAREILTEIAEDEQGHSNEFKRIYRMLTGRRFTAQVNPIQLTDTYENILRERIIDESGDYRKYGEQYIMTRQNIPLSDAYFKAMLDENVHALRIIYLLNRNMNNN